MILSEARKIVEKYAEQPVKDVVITVPPYFNQAERRAMAAAAEIAGLNLLQVCACVCCAKYSTTAATVSIGFALFLTRRRIHDQAVETLGKHA